MQNYIIQILIYRNKYNQLRDKLINKKEIIKSIFKEILNIYKNP